MAGKKGSAAIVADSEVPVVETPALVVDTPAPAVDTPAPAVDTPAPEPEPVKCVALYACTANSGQRLRCGQVVTLSKADFDALKAVGWASNDPAQIAHFEANPV